MFIKEISLIVIVFFFFFEYNFMLTSILAKTKKNPNGVR